MQQIIDLIHRLSPLFSGDLLAAIYHPRFLQG
jgi:hypothetical protein